MAGYIAMSILFRESNTEIDIMINSIRNDLLNRNSFSQSMALTLATNLGNLELIEALTENVYQILENPQEKQLYIIKKALICMGKVVKDGKMMINVAGESGEVVSFRLHNESTGEYFDLDTKVNYSQKIGSLKCPLSISSPVMTGISTIVTDEADEETYYDLYGRRVDGNNSTGIHI